MHPDWQELRKTWKIAFTGKWDGKLSICPSEKERPLDVINAWYGNTAKPKK